MFYLDVPDAISDKGLLEFYKRWRWRTDLYSPVQINFEHCNFLAPYAVTMFAAYTLWLRETKGCNTTIRALPNTVAGNYLVQCGLFELLGEVGYPEPAARSDRVVKLTRISSSSEIPKFATSVMNILQIEDEELAGAVQYSLIELLRNVVQHSASVGGGLAMAQYYPKTGLVDLFFIKQIASLSSGSFFLGSHDALVDIWGDQAGQQMKIYLQARQDGWPGTFAYLQLRRDTISEFDAVLTTCRRLAAEAQKYPSELALDFIEGIPDLGEDQDEIVIVSVKVFEEDVEEAARIRQEEILPSMKDGTMVVLDFAGVKFATQSFVHALMYRVIRDGQQIGSTLSMAMSRSLLNAAG